MLEDFVVSTTDKALGLPTEAFFYPSAPRRAGRVSCQDGGGRGPCVPSSTGASPCPIIFRIRCRHILTASGGLPDLHCTPPHLWEGAAVLLVLFLSIGPS